MATEVALVGVVATEGESVIARGPVIIMEEIDLWKGGGGSTLKARVVALRDNDGGLKGHQE